MIYLRSADRYDALDLARLRAASLEELGILRAADDLGAFVGRAAHAIGALFTADRIVAWIACDAERVVGSGCAVFYDRLPYPDGSRHAEVCGVYVEPAYRGAGLASELVREVAAAAQAGGARKTFLRPSGASKAMYARLGFVETDLMTFDRTAAWIDGCRPAASASRNTGTVAV